MDDIIILGDAIEDMEKLKKQLTMEFKIKHLDKLKYFLGIGVACSRNGNFISQLKYILDLL